MATPGKRKEKPKSDGDLQYGNDVVMDITKKLLSSRKILINQDIDDNLIESVVMQIELLNWEDDERSESEVGYDRMQWPITLYINSPGGYCTTGLAIISAIEQSITPIQTVVIGKAYSMAFMILMAGHVRGAYRHADMMYHQISYGNLSDHTDIVRQVTKNDELQQRMERLVLERTHIPRKKLQQIRDARIDWHMYPEEALELGVIDCIMERGLTVTKPPKPKLKKEPSK